MNAEADSMDLGKVSERGTAKERNAQSPGETAGGLDPASGLNTLERDPS